MGCMQNLIVQTPINCPLNNLAFPEIVYKMAKAHQGMFIWDISFLFDKQGRANFGEFCSNRYGWDAMPGELAMTGSCHEYFEQIKNGEYPLKFMFCSAVAI